MTKSELIDRVQQETGAGSKSEAKRFVEALIGEVSGALARGDKVSIPPLGTFSISDRAARKGRNPQTGEEIDIPASRGVRFKPAAQLKRLVNE